MGLLRKALEESEKHSSENKAPVGRPFPKLPHPLLRFLDVQTSKTLREILQTCHLLRAYFLKSFIKDLAAQSKG
jgi:hypothetical protein